MPDGDYRARFRANLRALMDAKNYGAATLKAPYLAGPKLGDAVALKSLSNLLSLKLTDDEISSPSLDIIAAVAAKLGVEPYILLVPDLDPSTHRTMPSETWIENEVERRVAARLARAVKAKQVLEVTVEEAASGRPSSAFPFIGGKTPAKGEASAPQEQKKPASRPKARAK